MKSLHFKSKEGYRKWLAHGHMRTKTGLNVAGKVGRKSVFASTPGNTRIYLGGRLHKVSHKRY